MGSAGPGKEWHHIVEQSQIVKSGFPSNQIHNTRNVIAVDKAQHSVVSSYYSSKRAFTQNLRVRNWLAGKSYEEQYQFGMEILKWLGII